MSSISDFFKSCFQSKASTSFKSAQESIVTTALDRLATNPNERIDIENIPGVIQQILEEMGESDWESVINDLYQKREQGIQEREAHMNTPYPCRRCGVKVLIRDLKSIDSIPGKHSNYCQSCVDLTVKEYTRTCGLCDKPYIITKITVAYDLCDDCYDQGTAYEHQRVRNHLRRAKELQLPATLTLKQWLAALDHFEWLCAYCDGEFSDLEHFMPLGPGSSTSVDNCVPACGSCNSKKHDCHPDELDGLFPADNLTRIREYLASAA
jgi:5-methylcytosine-specific restriction endonuclease McrA